MTEASFKCCSNEAWIHAGKMLPPCPTCGKQYVGREVIKDGMIIIYADEIKQNE